MQWDDVEEGVWTIASAAREKANAGSLRLPPAVLDLINGQPRIAGNPFVFAGRGTGPFNSFSQRTDELNKKLSDMPHWTLHDLRRTARTLMARAGVRPDISERVLGHTIKGVEGVSDVHDYSDEKADALTRLAALIETIINPPEGNVTEFAQEPRRQRRHAFKGSRLLVASGVLGWPIAFVYFRGRARPASAKLLTKDEAPRIAADVARLPDLLRKSEN